MNTFSKRALWFVVMLATAGLASGQMGSVMPGTTPSPQKVAGPQITGTITYHERMALPPDAAIEVKLEDVSLQDAAAKNVASTILSAAGQQVPISFQIPYNPADINPAHTYQVRANITRNGNLMFTSTTIYPVLTKGAPSQVAMIVQKVQAPAESAASADSKKLRDTHWHLVELNGATAIPGMAGRFAHLELYKTGQMSGSTGCNTFTGTYIAAIGGLQLTPGAVTMMACPAELMQQEQAFLAALKATQTYKIQGSTLELMNGQQVLAKFQAK